MVVLYQSGRHDHLGTLELSLPDGSISGTGMNSLNHYSYGSVVEFLYVYGAGIRPAEAGYRHAVIAPTPSVWLGSMHTSYQSNAGLYVSDWTSWLTDS